MTGVRAKNAYVDRRYRRKRVGKTRINRPDNGTRKSPMKSKKQGSVFGEEQR